MTDEWTISKLQELGISVKISNVFAVFDLQTHVDLKHIALSARNAEFKPRNGFKYVLIRYREPKGTVMIYRSGKVLVLGSTSLENAMISAKKTCSMLQKLEIDAQLNRFRIVNLLMSSDVKFRIRLEGLARDHAKFCTYEPELFPGLIYRVVEPKTTIVIFVSGKLVIVGLQDPECGKQALASLYPVLVQYRVQQRP